MANITKIRLSGTTYNIVDESAIHSLDGYATTEEVTTAITAATTALAEAIAEEGYQTSGDVQTAIAGKADSSAVTALNDTVTAHTADTTIHVTSADKTNWNAKVDASGITGFFGAVAYNSNDKKIYFYHENTGETALAFVDATDFIKDGMVDTVVIGTPSGGTYIGQTCLIITFNTDAGKEEIDIPIANIFDATNYYTTAQTDTLLATKLDASAYTPTDLSNYWTSAQTQSAITATIDPIEEVTAAALNDLNDRLEVVESGGTVTVDQTIISGSTNAVAGGAVYTGLQGKNQLITLSGETLIVS